MTLINADLLAADITAWEERLYAASAAARHHRTMETEGATPDIRGKAAAYAYLAGRSATEAHGALLALHQLATRHGLPGSQHLDLLQGLAWEQTPSWDLHRDRVTP